MTTTEFSNEFDILYDNLATKQAPGLDNYDKSVLLSKAQLEIVKNKYNPKGNKYGKGFENNEQRRVAIKELVTDYRTDILVNSTDKINTLSVMYQIPDDVLFIVFEEGTVSDDANDCYAGNLITIRPCSHDEYKTKLKNPFKRPDGESAMRLDLSTQDGNKVVEIFSAFPLSEYHMRYIKLPPPIILSDLDKEFVEEGLTIQGISITSDCVLDESIHQEILDRAVQMAMNYYKGGDLKSTVQLNTRNE